MYVGRDLWRSSTPTPPVIAGTTSKLAQVAQGFIKSNFESFQRWRFQNLSGQFLWCSHSTAYAHWSIPCSNVQPLLFLDSLHISGKRSIFSTVPFRWWSRARGRFLFSWLDNLCSFSLSLHLMLSKLWPSSWPFIGLLPACWPCLVVCLGEPKRGHSISGGSSPVLSRGK